MNIKQKLTLRELMLDQLLQEKQMVQSPSGPGIDSFKASLRQLEGQYAVAILLPDGQSNRLLAGRPLQLLITPHDESSSKLLIRVSGVFFHTDESQRELDFKPVTINVSRVQSQTAEEEFRHETDSSLDVIGHVHQVLATLKHKQTATVALYA